MSRFHEPQHPDFQRLNTSIGFDRRLWPQDIAQSRAHARMLAERGIIARRTATRCSPGSTRSRVSCASARAARVDARGRKRRFAFHPDDEDIHMAIERRLTEIVGPVGGRLHTARSRNDQVVTDLAMYTRERGPPRRRARSRR